MRLPAVPLALLMAVLPAQAAPGWTALFNGRDLDNFDIAYSSRPVDGRPASALFEVRDGVVRTYPGIAPGTPVASAYFQTREAHGDYVLHVEYRWDERKFVPRMNRLRDAGIIFHAYDAPENSWPHGVEAQIEEKDAGDLWLITTQARTAVKPSAHPGMPDPLQDNSAAYAPGGQQAVVGGQGKYTRLRHSADYEHPGWNSMDVVVRGDSAVYLVNGRVNMRLHDIRRWDDAAKDWVRLDRGKILFQAEYAGISYRDIKIRPVTESDPR
jgi:hypothetical protein